MNTDGQSFLDRLAGPAADGFAVRFSRISTRLDLGVCLCASDVSLLYEAAFYAALCNISFNGQGGCGGQIKPYREPNRRILEWRFLMAHDKFCASEGWHALTARQRESIRNIFFQVKVSDDNLAW
jgi:hypothetical protein